MKRWIGSALPAVMIAFGICVIAVPAASSDVREKPLAQTADTSHRGDSRRDRRDASRPSPAYYGRPASYAPTPYTPIPPLAGFRWEWW